MPIGVQTRRRRTNGSSLTARPSRGPKSCEVESVGVAHEHCDLALLRNESACRAFAARDGFTQGISDRLLLGSQPLTMNRDLPVNVRFHSLSFRRGAMVVT
jgi:hypothetical protein